MSSEAVGSSTTPSVAIIIPAYNAEAWMAEAIDSALAQTYPAASVVVVDDGSTDRTAEIASGYADAVIVLRQANAGVCAARNHGAAQVAPNWLLFLDADDRLRPDALENLLARSAHGNFGVIHGRSADFREGTGFEKEHGNGTTEGSAPTAARVSFWKAPIATPGAALICQDTLANAGGWHERFNTTADRHLWCRLGTRAQFAYVDEVVVERRMHGDNMSSDRNRARRQAVEVQLDFLAWCAERSIDTAFLETSEEQIFVRNTERALAERAFIAGEWIASEAMKRGFRHELFDRAQRMAAMPGFARDLELKVREFLQR
jgi:glycosyltransferase involved in cell wall biosynthesis